MTALEAKRIVGMIQGLNEEEDNENIYHFGLIYLKNRKMTAQWESSKAFWDWFKLQYNNCCLQAVKEARLTSDEKVKDCMKSTGRRFEFINFFHGKVGGIFDSYPAPGVVPIHQRKLRKIKNTELSKT